MRRHAQALKYRGHPLDHPIPSELLLHPAAPRRAVSRGARRVGEQVVERRGEAVGVVRRDEEPGLAVDDDVGDPADPRADARQAEGHRLDEREAVGLEERRQAEHPRPRVQVGQRLPVVDPTEDRDPRPRLRLGGADDLEAGVGEPPADLRERRSQDVPAFPRVVLAHEEDRRCPLRVATRRQGREIRPAPHGRDARRGDAVEGGQRRGGRRAHGEEVQRIAVDRRLLAVPGCQVAVAEGVPQRPPLDRLVMGVVDIQDVRRPRGAEERVHLEHDVARRTEACQPGAAVPRLQPEGAVVLPEPFLPARAHRVEGGERDGVALPRAERRVDASGQGVAPLERVEEVARDARDTVGIVGVAQRGTDETYGHDRLPWRAGRAVATGRIYAVPIRHRAGPVSGAAGQRRGRRVR